LETAADLGIELQGGRVLVVVEGDTTILPQQLTALGGEIDSVAHDRLSLLAPVSALAGMAALDGVEYVRQPLPGHALELSHAGSVTSEGVALMGADTWHGAGIEGSGVTAAIVDMGFAGWQSLQSSGDLPTGAQVECVDFTTGTDCGNAGGSDHGSALAEILYDTAPGVDAIYLYAFDDDADIAAIVDHMVITASIDVASMAISWANGGPYDGSGPIAAEVNRAREQGDIFWAVAAGNSAQRHFEATFDQGDCSWGHDFDPASGSCGNLNSLGYQQSDEEICLFLEWNAWPTTDQDYDLYVYRKKNMVQWQLEWFSNDLQDGDDPPVEGGCFRAPEAGTYYYLVDRFNADSDHYFEVISWTDDFGLAVIESSVLEPATADGAVAVGAFDQAAPTTLESFSAHGPRNPAGGGPYDPSACGATPTAECKVDFAGPDWVSTVSRGVEGFGGTSAATPHVAGAAALVWSAFPHFDRDDVYDYLRQYAAAPGTRSTSQDPGWGWGRVQLGGVPTAVELLGFHAALEADGVRITWQTATEIDLLGFNIYRSVTPGGEPVRLNGDLIPPQAPGSSFGGEYSWLDEDVEPGNTYAYLLEDQDVNGQLATWGPVEVTVPARIYLPLVIR
jgi:subtilisin family serine protease